MCKIYFLLILAIAVVLSGCSDGIQSADDLIATHLEALGGYENYKAIHTLTYVGTYEESRFKEVHRFDRKRPNLIRITTSYDEQAGTFGYCEGFDGAAWEYSSRIPVRVVGEPSRALRNASRFEPPYIDYKRKGHAVELTGKTNIKENEVYHLRVMYIDGREENFFFDVITLMESVSIGNAPFHGEGASIEIFEKRSNYRPVSGVLFPFRVEQTTGEEILSTVAWDKIAANVEVPNDWFSPPLSQDEGMFKDFREDMIGGLTDQMSDRYKEYRELSNRLYNKKLENQMNTFGYELISYERKEDAITVFQLAIEYSPNSGNLHDSLGEVYLAIGDTANAIKHYKKSVELNPKNDHGKEILLKILSQ